MAVSPGANADEIVTIEVSVNGSVIKETYEVVRIEVIKEINRIPVATVVLNDGDPSSLTFDASDSGDFVPGADIVIKAGYESTNTAIFTGVIVRHGIQVQENGLSYLSLTCADKAIGMTVARNNRQFANSTDSAVMSKLIGDAGLSASVDSTSVEHEYLVQYYTTDWDYVLTRADVNEMVTIVDAGKVTVAKPKFDGPPLTVQFGDSLNSFDGEVDAVSQLSSVSARSWDPGSQALQTGASSEPSVNAQSNLSGKTLASVLGVSSYELQTMGTASTDELTAWANSSLLKSRLAKVQGKVAFNGSALAEPGTTLEIKGLGDRLDGNAYISAVRHVIASGHWETEAGFGISQHWFADLRPRIQAPPASGLRPAASGLQIAKVKQVYEDPQGQRRVLVTWPLMGDGGPDGIWVRIAAPYASNNAGMVFLPEVGDEVVLGFLGNDPTAAVVLGSLHSSQLTAPFEPDDQNTDKGIITRSQLKMTFDDVKKVTVISTPGGHTMTFSDEDQSITLVDSNSNKMEMNSSGITMSSPSDINISADGNVSIKGQGGIDISSPASVSMKGMSVSISADTSLSASGGSDASFSASGTTTVKGAMVMIN